MSTPHVSHLTAAMQTPKTPAQQIVAAGDDSLRDTLGRLSTPRSSVRGAASTKLVDLYSQLEAAYATLEEREKDLQLAAEIGQMLLKKNEGLAEQHAAEKRRLDARVRARLFRADGAARRRGVNRPCPGRRRVLFGAAGFGGNGGRRGNI